MKTQIKIKNGSGWNNYAALKSLKSLPRGTRGLMAKNNCQRITIAPADSERPLGIAARFFDADGYEIYTKYFDQNDTAEWIAERVVSLLQDGIAETVEAKRRALARKYFYERITAWRRNWDFKPKTKNAFGPLRAKLGELRRAGGNRISRGRCTELTADILSGRTTFNAAKSLFV